jgi:hypothetical protein
MSTITSPPAVRWPDEVEDIVVGDVNVALAYATPASGVVILPVTNFATRDREAGTITVNTSVGAWKKLDRIRRNPNVALAFHTRAHGSSERPEYVLAQGTATLSDPIPDYPSTVIEEWSRLQDWGSLGPLWRRWLRVYALRVEITVRIERLVIWPDLACSRRPVVDGDDLPPPPRSQRPPAKGTGPRINHRWAARRAKRLPHVMLGWVGGDDKPVVVPVEVGGATDDGIALGAPGSLVPPGGRRAGLTAHSFAERNVGQNQRKHTGWLVADSLGERLLYAPHTASNYRFPASDLLFQLVSGGATRVMVRGARRAGVV